MTRFKVGDEVFGLSSMSGSCFAEYVVAKENYISLILSLPPKEAGGSTIVFGTAWFTLFTNENLSTFDIHAQKHKGKTIFVAGGGGGVGHVIVQLAKKSGYHVISSAGKPESIKICKESGADHVIDYSTSDVIEEVNKLTNKEGVDVAVDCTCVASSNEQSASIVKKGGIWISLGTKWEDKHQKVLSICKERDVTAANGDFGRYWYIPSYIAKAPIHIHRMLETCDKLYKEDIYVRITKVISFEKIEEIKEEVKAVGESKRSGKVVIEIGGDK